MRPKWPKLASLVQKMSILQFQLFGAFIAAKEYTFNNLFNTRKKLLNQKFLKEGCQYHKIRKPFLNFIDETMI